MQFLPARRTADATASPAHSSKDASPHRRLPANMLRIGALLLAVALAGILVLDGSRAAFTAQTGSGTNQVGAGEVKLTDNDSGQKLFDVTGLNGGQVVQKCITVTYSGTLGADVRLHGTTAGDLAPGLTTKVEVGTGATGGSFSCTGFTPGGTEFNGTLAQFGTSHGTFANGLKGFEGAAQGDTRSYRITMTVSNDNSYQGKSATVVFTWEAQGKDKAL